MTSPNDTSRQAALTELQALGQAFDGGWRDIASLTRADGYVLGWTHRDDGCAERCWFIGMLYDMRANALLNEWTGKWRVVDRWMPLPAPPSPELIAAGVVPGEG